MTLTDTTARSRSDAISFQLDLAHPPKKVWRALTDPALLGEWLLPVMGLELEPGAAFRFQAPPKPGWDGTVTCRFLEIEPYRRLSYTWAVDFGLDTVVTFTLEPTPAGTRVLLVQSGFKEDQKQNVAGARYGWKLMGGRLADLLASVP